MKKTKIIKQPFSLLIAVVIIAALVLFFQSLKPDIQVNAPLTDADLKNLQQAVNSAENNEIRPAINPEKEGVYPRAPNFGGIERWINSEPLSMESLRGNVVLIDFWTYTCINCIRTLPYLKEWDKKYRGDGLVIVGVHTPEFAFEKKYENVLDAINEYELEYPVAQDNNYVTWRLWQNRYWPHKFLVDADGYVRYDHIGEGSYEETEKVIQQLLKESDDKKDIDLSIISPEEIDSVVAKGVKTPELYFGYKFTRGNFGNPEGFKPNEAVDYNLPLSLFPNKIYLEGKWKNNEDGMELMSDEGSIVLIYQASVVNIVAGSDESTDAKVYLDNEALNQENRGGDITLKDDLSISKVDEYKLYNLVSTGDSEQHIVSINTTKGFKIFTFTFG
jgi:thiol-disulfide isomerase/thioredoxin